MIHFTNVSQHQLKARYYGSCCECGKLFVSALGEVPSEWGDKRTPSEKDMGPTRPGAYGSWWKLLSSLNNQVWRSPHVQGGRLDLISTRQRPSSCTPHGCLPRWASKAKKPSLWDPLTSSFSVFFVKTPLKCISLKMHCEFAMILEVT